MAVRPRSTCMVRLSASPASPPLITTRIVGAVIYAPSSLCVAAGLCTVRACNWVSGAHLGKRVHDSESDLHLHRIIRTESSKF